MLTKLEGRSTREFSIERPTRGMVDTWKLALISITSSRYTRESPLGCFLVHPHNNADWYASEDGKHIYHFLDDNNVVSYSLPPNSRHTRRPQYLRDDSSPANVCRFELKLASVFVSQDENYVRLHSVAPQPAPNTSQVPTVLDALRAGPNPSLWDNFTCDDDGWWIADALHPFFLVVRCRRCLLFSVVVVLFFLGV